MMAGWLCAVPFIGRAEDGWACGHEECAVDDGLRRAGVAHTEDESRLRTEKTAQSQGSALEMVSGDPAALILLTTQTETPE